MLTYEIRSLVSRYGYKSVREELEKEMKETYEYLRGLYGSQETGTGLQETPKKYSRKTGDSKEKLETSKPGKVSRKTLEKTGDLEKVPGDTGVPGKTGKSGETEKFQEVPATLQTGNLPAKTGESQDVEEIRENTGEKTVVLTNIPDRQESRNVVIIEKIDGTEESSIGHEETGNEPMGKKKSWPFHGKSTVEKPATVKKTVETNEISDTSKVYPTKEEMKAKRSEHNRKVALKKVELQQKGINGYSLLKKDKLENWLSEGWTYWKIAEETGIHEDDISKLAKSLGLSKKTGSNAGTVS
jgi:hypothetical protein